MKGRGRKRNYLVERWRLTKGRETTSESKGNAYNADLAP
jgi:hypothetical protein